MDLELEQAAREVMWWKLVREAHFYGERSAPPEEASGTTLPALQGRKQGVVQLVHGVLRFYAA